MPEAIRSRSKPLWESGASVHTLRHLRHEQPKNSPKITQEFIDGKHTDIYNELKQMAFDKEAMEMLFSEELAHTDWVTMEKEIRNLENDNSDKDQMLAEKDDQISALLSDNSDKEQRISVLLNDNSNKEQQIAEQAHQLSALKEELERLKASLNQ